MLHESKKKNKQTWPHHLQRALIRDELSTKAHILLHMRHQQSTTRWIQIMNCTRHARARRNQWQKHEEPQIKWSTSCKAAGLPSLSSSSRSIRRTLEAKGQPTLDLRLAASITGSRTGPQVGDINRRFASASIGSGPQKPVRKLDLRFKT